MRAIRPAFVAQAEGPLAQKAARDEMAYRRVMQQAIKQRRCQRGVLRRRRVPLAKRQIARHDQAAPLVQRGDHLEEQVDLITRHRQVADRVDDEQAICLDRTVHHRLQVVFPVRRRQRQHQLGGGGEARLDAGLGSFVAQRDLQVRLADAAGPHQHHVLATLRGTDRHGQLSAQTVAAGGHRPCGVAHLK